MNELLTPEEFDSKYKQLSVVVDRDSFSMRKTIRVITSKKDICTWKDLISYDASELKINNDVNKKYPALQNDLLRSKPYWLAFVKNLKKKCELKNPTLPKDLKKLHVKEDDIRYACEENDPCLYAYKKLPHDFKRETEMLNVVIEVSRNNGINHIQKDYDDEVLWGVRFTFKTKNTEGQYKVAFYECSTGFKKLLLKYITESYEITL